MICSMTLSRSSEIDKDKFIVKNRIFLSFRYFGGFYTLAWGLVADLATYSWFIVVYGMIGSA